MQDTNSVNVTSITEPVVPAAPVFPETPTMADQLQKKLEQVEANELQRKTELAAAHAAPYTSTDVQQEFHQKLTAELGADPAYFSQEEVAVATNAIIEAEAAAIHPLAVEVSTKMQGLTAEEVLAGLMPELSALYRQREELETKNERQAKVIEYYQGELNTISSQLAIANQEVSFAFRAGQDLERAVGEQQADLVRLDTSNTVLAQKSNTYLADLRCIHNLMMNLLMRGRKFKDDAAAQEYVQGLAQRTALELTEEVVFASTDSGQFSTNFGSRVAATRQSLHSQAVAAESQMAVVQETTNEQDTGSEGLLQGQ